MSKSISELFIKECLKTESVNFAEIQERLSKIRTIRLLHAALGLSTEANEFLDALKKYIFYGKELDLVNIAEELGDGNWYESIALDEIGKTYEEIWAAVIKKLQARYKGNFNKEEAVNRDLYNEREILENNLHEMTENVVDRVKEEIIAEPVTHWLADVDKLTVLCTNQKIKENESYTLEEDLVTCSKCIYDLASHTI